MKSLLTSVVARFYALLARREEGATLVEYALLIALIALACIVAIGLLGNGIGDAFNNIKAKLP
jgi:pilus assembly protein Flp/PilA